MPIQNQSSTAHRISVQAALDNAGVDMADLSEDPACVPACCSEGCEVEPDGVCVHGFKSVLLVLGVI